MTAMGNAQAVACACDHRGGDSAPVWNWPWPNCAGVVPLEAGRDRVFRPARMPA